jgi:hypothetical protein
MKIKEKRICYFNLKILLLIQIQLLEIANPKSKIQLPLLYTERAIDLPFMLSRYYD